MANIYHSDLDAFSIYHQTHQSSQSHTQGPIFPALGHALAGSTGSAIANLATYPLDLVVKRLQIQRSLRLSSAHAEDEEYKGVADAFEKIYAEEGGLKAFYSGIVQDTGKTIADAFLFFLFYNFFRTRRLQKHGERATTLPVFDELAVGVLAGACSKAFTTPISNIVTRKQTASMIISRSSSNSKTPELSVAEIISQIRKEKGVQGFWSGYSASLILTLNPSITFFLHESFKRALLPRVQRDDPGARTTFLMAAFSKAIASTITYPFSLAKSRAQASSRPPVDEETKIEVKKVVDGLEHIENETDAKKDVKKVSREARRVVKQSTIFGTVLKIYKAEGIEGLYEGVWGEILKGFFSHGVTMLVKESVHKLIIQAYFWILKTLNRYPTPQELAQRAGSAIQDAGEKASSAVQGAVESGREVVGASVERAGSAIQSAGEKASSAMQGAVETGRGAMQTGKETMTVGAERAGAIGANATELAREYVAGKDSAAAEVVRNTREVVGGTVEEVGRMVRPDTGRNGESE